MGLEGSAILLMVELALSLQGSWDGTQISSSKAVKVGRCRSFSLSQKLVDQIAH